MGRLVTGVTIVLFLLITTTLLAFIRQGTASAESIPGCTTNDNATACENVGKTTFFAAVRDVAVGNIDDQAPTIINVLWVLIMATLLTTAVFLIVTSFIPTRSE